MKLDSADWKILVEKQQKKEQLQNELQEENKKDRNVRMKKYKRKPVWANRQQHTNNEHQLYVVTSV